MATFWTTYGPVEGFFRWLFVKPVCTNGSYSNCEPNWISILVLILVIYWIIHRLKALRGTGGGSMSSGGGYRV